MTLPLDEDRWAKGKNAKGEWEFQLFKENYPYIKIDRFRWDLLNTILADHIGVDEYGLKPHRTFNSHMFFLRKKDKDLVEACLLIYD